jgi:hypothetical protein
MKFRPQALAKLQKPRAVDAPIQLAHPRSLLSLGVVTLLMVVGAFWAVFGSVPQQTGATGILTHAEGSNYLQSPYSGQITGVFVSEGSVFPADTPLFTVQDGAGVQTVRSFTGGRVISVFGAVGQEISRGTQLAVIETINQTNDPLIAMLYLPQASAGTVHVGSQVDLTVASAPADQFGVLRGTVQSISQFPQTEGQISTFLGDPQLAEQFSAQGQPFGVEVSLATANTTSGFDWSTGAGPPYQIDSRTLVSASIQLAPIKPIGWLVS